MSGLARNDTDFMQAALNLATRALGSTAPNPAVGALVVRNGQIVGRGFTQPGGRPHAETMALANAGALARGATLYVTLEPCVHHGKTAPCTDAIIASGIARVVSALEDPDPRVAGKGYLGLEQAGIGVTKGVMEEEARRMNLGHILRVTQGRPMVTLKFAQTADGFVAGGEHDARLMISCPAAHAFTHVLRHQHDAIMVGIGTILADDPLMTVRLPGVANSGLNGAGLLRVVLDTKLALPLRSRLVQTARECPVLVLAGPKAPDTARRALEAAGVEVQNVTTADNGHVDLRAALAALGARGVTRVFSEGGPRAGSALIAEGLADEVIMVTSPRPFGRKGVAALNGTARGLLADKARYALLPETMIGTDAMRHYIRVL